MKKYLSILTIGLFFSFTAPAQSPRKCGCKTWRQWSTSIPKKEGESRWKRRQLYDAYLHQCMIDCREKMLKEQQRK